MRTVLNIRVIETGHDNPCRFYYDPDQVQLFAEFDDYDARRNGDPTATQWVSFDVTTREYKRLCRMKHIRGAISDELYERLNTNPQKQAFDMRLVLTHTQETYRKQVAAAKQAKKDEARALKKALRQTQHQLAAIADKTLIERNLYF